MELRIPKESVDVFPLEGVVLCEVRISLPCIGGEGRAALRINRFYTAIAASVQELCRVAVLPLAEEAFRNLESPRKRVTWRPFRLISGARAEAVPDGWHITRTLTLAHRAHTLLCEQTEELILPSGLVRPVRRERG